MRIYLLFCSQQLRLRRFRVRLCLLRATTVICICLFHLSFFDFFIFHTFFINEHNQIIFLLWAINNNSAKFPLISYLFHRHTHANEIFHFVSRFVFVFDEFSHLLLSWERFPVAVFQTKYTRSLYTYTRIRRSNRILHSCLLTNFFFSGAK